MFPLLFVALRNFKGGMRNANCGIFTEEDRKIADRQMKWNEQQRRKDAKGLSLQPSRLRVFAVQSVPFDSCASVICGYRRDAKSAETAELFWFSGHDFATDDSARLRGPCLISGD